MFASANDGRRNRPNWELLHCIDKNKLDLIIAGKFASYIFKYMEINLKLCLDVQPNGEPCAPIDEMISFFSDYTMQASFVNSLVNVKEDAGNVNVLPVIDDRAYFHVNLQSTQTANLYVKESHH